MCSSLVFRSRGPGQSFATRNFILAVIISRGLSKAFVSSIVLTSPHVLLIHSSGFIAQRFTLRVHHFYTVPDSTRTSLCSDTPQFLPSQPPAPLRTRCFRCLPNGLQVPLAGQPGTPSVLPPATVRMSVRSGACRKLRSLARRLLASPILELARSNHHHPSMKPMILPRSNAIHGLSR